MSPPNLFGSGSVFWSAPSSAAPPLDGARTGRRHVRHRWLAPVIATVARVRRVEGPRGAAERIAVAQRAGVEFGALGGCVALTHAVFSGSRWAAGGMLMAVCATALMVICAVATLVYPPMRMETVREMRRYLWGIVVLPGTSIALFERILRGFLGGPAVADDFFLSLVSWSLPVIFAITVLLPVPLFAKAAFGHNSLNRVTDDPEEMLRIYTRQDGLQR